MTGAAPAQRAAGGLAGTVTVTQSAVITLATHIDGSALGHEHVSDHD